MKKILDEKGMSSLNIALVVAIVLLLLSNGLTLFYLISRHKQPEEKHIENLSIKNFETSQQQEKPLPPAQKTVKNPEDVSPPNIVEENEPIVKEKEDLGEGEIMVEWNEWPEKSKYWDLASYNDWEDMINNYNRKEKNNVTTDILEKFTIYNTGKISQGPHAGNNLYIMTFWEEGPAFRETMYRVIKDNNDLILLANYSDEPYGVYKEFFIRNDKIKIKNLEPQKNIAIPNSPLSLTKEDQEPFLLMENIKTPVKLLEYTPKSAVYKGSNNCFFTRANDGTARYYYFDADFFEKPNKDKIRSGVLNVTWNNGDKNKNEYTYEHVGRCGAGLDCYAYGDYITSVNQLEKTGQGAGGEIFYEMKDKKFTLKDAKESILKEMYNLYYPGWNENSAKEKDKPPFEEFLSDHPIIYWQDPFGKFIEFRNMKYQPAVECGKPVIYLYPEKETNVSVKVNPTGGFTKTEPAYNAGWMVKATPDSQIYNYADKTSYSYLFWEGHALNYKRPEKGFMVKKENVKKFLQEELAALGLIEKEYSEFIEFWLPKMQDKNYYFITFVPQEEFDNLAPLNISPRPSTIIRIFMDYEGLENPAMVEAPKIVTPERKGFTVVEWGGALHK